MRLLFTLFLLFAIGCASSEDKSKVPSDIADATSDAASSDAGTPPPAEGAPSASPGDTNEQDLQGNPMAGADTPQAAAPAAPDDLAQAAPPPAEAPEAIPPPDTAQPNTAQNEAPPPSPEVEPPPASPATTVATGEPATLTGLDFKGNVNGGTIVIRTDKPVEYTTRRNEQANQFIIDLKNTAVPSRFRRPYTTKEFPGPIAQINAYQSHGAREGHIVVQLRESVEPSVNQDGNIISVAGAGGAPAAETAENNAPPAAEPPPAVQNEQDQSAAENVKVKTNEEDEVSSQANEKQVLANHTLSDFLTGNTKFVGRPISLEVKDSDVGDVFRFISEETGLNIVVGDDVTGKITMKLRRIPWDQALAIILQSKQLGYVKQGNILRIAKLKTLQEESDAARSVIDSQRQLQPLHVQVFPISYAKAADMATQAKDFLSPRGKTQADQRTNNLVVTDIDENLNRIRQLIKRLDTQTPQVLIEAKVVEARETFEKIVGVNWGFSGDTLPLGTNTNNSGPITLQPNSQLGTAGATPPFLSAGFSISNMDIFGNLTATLSLLESEQLVKVISAPRIVTLDRVEANIQQTTQFPVFSATIVNNTPIAQVTFQDVRLELNVTPQITTDGAIIMTVKVIREFPDATLYTSGSSSARAINKRQATTQVLVENGDTVVIGGIYQSDVSEGEVGVPWLRQIPIIGALFRQRTTEKDKNELVIFLTPRILNKEKAFMKQGEPG